MCSHSFCFLKEHNHCVVVSDEVYEWLTYDNVKHERIATLPGMWERTITISSASKTFSVTGWKIGTSSFVSLFFFL